MRSVFSSFLSAALFLCLISQASAADPYPQRPLRLIVGAPPGGSSDTVARIVAQRLSETFGRPVVVDNRPGGGQIIATQLAANSAPDGHTLLIVAPAFAVNPSLRKLPYDTEKDFIPVTQMWAAPNLLIVNPSLPLDSVKELIAHAKLNPGKINYGSAGNGSSTHFAGEMLRTMAAIDIVHVPYKGDAPAIAALLGGQIHVLFTSLGPVVPHLKAGRLKALAVASPSPFLLMPDLPTVANAGIPGFASFIWNGIVVPHMTPTDIVNRLQVEIARVLAQPETRNKLLELGFEPIGNTPSQFKEFLLSETKRMAKVVSDAGIRIE